MNKRDVFHNKFYLNERNLITTREFPKNFSFKKCAGSDDQIVSVAKQ